MKAFLLCLLLTGCVTLSADEQYDVDDRRTRNHDKIMIKLKHCTTFITYVGRASTRDRRKMQRDRFFIPRNAKPHGFVCGWPERIL